MTQTARVKSNRRPLSTEDKILILRRQLDVLARNLGENLSWLAMGMCQTDKHADIENHIIKGMSLFIITKRLPLSHHDKHQPSRTLSIPMRRVPSTLSK